MTEKQPLLPLPPLSVQALHDLQEIEDFATEALKGLDDFFPSIGSMVHGHNSPKRVERVLRTYLVAHLDIQINYYSSLPERCPIWIAQIISSSIGSLLGLFPIFVDVEPYRGTLRQTAAEHIKTRQLHFPKPKLESPIGIDNDRKALRDEYLARFSGEVLQVKILDICWAAGQHYSEWKRWLRNALPNGSTPDRAFRAILASEKLPRDYKRQPRPKGWK